MGFLEKISWKTRRWNYSFQLLYIGLHDQDESWGFSFFNIIADRKVYSLLRFEFRLPNMTNVRVFSIDAWDFLFLYNYIFRSYDDLSDRELWGSKLNWFERMKLSIFKKIV